MDLCKMFMKIAARAAESDESYDTAANCAEQLAQDVEKCLKIRVDPELRNSDTTKGKYCTYNCLNFSKLRLTFSINVAGLNIDSSRISKHNQGLAVKPKGIKVKEKTSKGSRRPVGGFEKATSKKKKNTDAIAQIQPEGTSTV
jgi:zinc finger SWIM domain-containing protein 3